MAHLPPPRAGFCSVRRCPSVSARLGVHDLSVLADLSRGGTGPSLPHSVAPSFHAPSACGRQAGQRHPPAPLLRDTPSTPEALPLGHAGHLTRSRQTSCVERTRPRFSHVSVPRSLAVRVPTGPHAGERTPPCRTRPRHGLTTPRWARQRTHDCARHGRRGGPSPPGRRLDPNTPDPEAAARPPPASTEHAGLSPAFVFPLHLGGRKHKSI